MLREREKALSHRWTDCSKVFSQNSDGLSFAVCNVFLPSNELMLAECYYSFPEKERQKG